MCEENKNASKGQMIYFDTIGNQIDFNSKAKKGSFLVLSGKALNEPIVRNGPFIANTESEMKQIILNFNEGKMGKLL